MLTVYGDVNCPYSLVASRRVDRLAARGVRVDWRMVEHDRAIPAAGRPGGEALDRELVELAGLVAADELPARPPTVVPQSRAAVSAYAEATVDGTADTVRRALFAAVWDAGRNISDALPTREVVAAAVEPAPPAGPVGEDRRTPNQPVVDLGDPDVQRISRRMGVTISPSGGPTSTAAQRSLDLWREEWLAISGGTVPVVVDESGTPHVGVAGLVLLGRLLEGSAAYPGEASGTTGSVLAEQG